MPEVLVGIDLGSTRFKAAVFDASHGRQLSAAGAPTPWLRTGPAAELEAEDVRTTVGEVVHAAATQIGGEIDVVGVGVTGMAETGFLLDNENLPLAPAAAWYDDRASTYVDDVARLLDPANFSATTGLPLTSRCTAVKTRWLASERPDIRGARRFASLPEWVVHTLGGELVSELSLASRTGWMDTLSCEWVREHVRASMLPNLELPTPVPAGTPAGHANTDAANCLAGATLTVAGHDHVCAAVGAGAHAQTDLLDSIGTGEALVRWVRTGTERATVSRAVDAGLTVGRHVNGAQSIFVGLGTGRALGQILELLGINTTDPAAIAALDTAALALDASSTPRPARDDLNSPEWTDLATRRGAAEAWRAALETAGRRARSAADAIAEFAGPATRTIAVGGWMASEAMRRTKAAALGPVLVPDVGEAAARGAALLAGIAAGRYRCIDELPQVEGTCVRW